MTTPRPPGPREDMYYSMARSRLGLAVILNNLDTEQQPTKQDVDRMGGVLRDIGNKAADSTLVQQSKGVDEISMNTIFSGEGQFDRLLASLATKIPNKAEIKNGQ